MDKLLSFHSMDHFNEVAGKVREQISVLVRFYSENPDMQITTTGEKRIRKEYQDISLSLASMWGFVAGLSISNQAESAAQAKEKIRYLERTLEHLLKAIDPRDELHLRR